MQAMMQAMMRYTYLLYFDLCSQTMAELRSRYVSIG